MIQKNMTSLTRLFLGISILITTISCTSSTNPPTATNGLNIAVTTSAAGGQYAPKNVLAIWIVDNAGKFIKSLTVNAAERKNDLTRWNSSSLGSTVDATTSATRSGHGTIYATWNGTDTSKKVVADGTYKVCMELSDKDGSGNYSTFTFVKGATAQTQTPANVASFTDISLNWLPL